MTMRRRTFLGLAAAAGATAAAGRAEARAGDTAGAGECSVLVDTTLCVGCRSCEAACAEANGLPTPVDDPPGLRKTSPTAFTAVSTCEREGDEPRHAKRQCMHCVEPACASACPVRALDKLPGGPVTYHPERCMGCRYCMVACPFEVPKYEFDKAIPRVRKCTFCAARQARGEAPACTSACPAGALTFGRRGALVEEARRRVYGQPGKYLPHVYGEHEAGGTNWLYVSDVDFARLGFQVAVNDASYPQLVKGALGVPPFVMTLWPPLLMGIYAITHRKARVARDEAGPAREDGEDHHG